MDENKKYEVIKGLVNHPNPNKNRAALTLGCTIRHINRMLAGYKQLGKDFFIHGNKGRQPYRKITVKSSRSGNASMMMLEKKYVKV